MVEANRIIHGDCLAVMRDLPTGCVDLVLCSPPYEAARTYSVGFDLRGQVWVDWMMPRIVEMARITKGLVCIVCEGQTKNFRYSATPILLMADLHRAGFNLRKPPIFHRVGIPGSGGPDWLRNDYEFCVCVTPPGRLPWSSNTAMGKPPKYAPGGPMSNRDVNGRRKTHQHTKANGETITRESRKVATLHRPGMHAQPQSYTVPKIANPGNVIRCTVGGGVMGSKLAHENEAPYPEALAEFFIKSFCPTGGIVLDPFAGSGTTLAVAHRHGRRWLGIECRESQVELSERRVMEAKPARGPESA